MKRNRIRQIIALITISLIGLVLIQLYWIDNALELKKEHFNQSINKALRNTVTKLEKKEALAMINNKVMKFYLKEYDLMDYDSCLQRNISFIHGYNSKLVKMVAFPDEDVICDPGIKDKDKECAVMIPNNKTRIVAITGNDSVHLKITKKLPDKQKLTRKYITSITSNSDSFENKKVVVKEVIMDIIKSNRSIIDRINIGEMQDILKTELENSNITLPFEYAIIEREPNSSLLMGSGDFKEEMLSTAHMVSLFPGSTLDAGMRYLAVFFPGEKTHILMSLWIMLSFSIILIICVVIGFTHTIITIINQKKLADIKADFINNLTHEFKTPISTIALATEAMKDNTITKDKKQTRKFYNIIEQENRKLEDHVEKVLNISLLEKNEFKIKPSVINMHEIIREGLKHAELQIKKGGVDVSVNLSAENPMIIGDREHILHMFTNLLDNAIKYSLESPSVIIKTKNENSKLWVSIKDSGIGISKDAQQKIFDKFYRVTKGNIHDIKGFGLGLSYVKKMVEAHNGKITVKSELNKGSEFIITIPNEKSSDNGVKK